MAIYVRLSGGLGNQIFQLAAAIHLRKDNEDIFLNPFFLNTYKVTREFGLGNIFDLNKMGIKICNNKYVHCIFFTRLSKIIGVTDSNIKSYKRISKNIYLDGYFQMFWDSLNVKKAFNFLKSFMKDVCISKENKCIIHFRATDFLDDDNFNIIPRDWYYNSIIKMSSYTNSFVVVTDDINFAKSFFSNFNLKNLSIVFQSEDLFKDFDVIRSHKLAIIGNSTFSITSLLLSNSITKIIAFPYFTKGNERRWNLI